MTIPLTERAVFYQRMDDLLRAGHAAEHVANVLGVNPRTVRRRRIALERGNALPYGADARYAVTE